MKNLTNLMKATFLVCLMSLSAMLKAQTNYSLLIAGTRVTSANAGDITAAINDTTKVSGIISYDHATQTLKLNGATINVGNGIIGIHSTIARLKIELTGVNRVNSTSQMAILSDNTFSIKGDTTASLLARSISFAGIYQYFCNLTITGGCTVTANGGDYGIGGQHGATEELTISGGSTVKATGQLVALSQI